MTLKDGSKIKYQSNPEYRFINWCEENDILIKNGPRISYIFNSKLSTYVVDFELPEYNKLIEIKDNHIWHKLQVESGKWGKKELAANNWCKDHGYTYEMIFPKTYSNFKHNILKIMSSNITKE